MQPLIIAGIAAAVVIVIIIVAVVMMQSPNQQVASMPQGGNANPTANPTVNPAAVSPDATVERPDAHCGPSYGGAKCGPGRCCSIFGWCGNAGESHCTKALNSPLYNGSGAVVV